jgi:hypothetical protein
MSKIGQHQYGSTSDWTKRAGIVKQFNSGASTLSAAPDAAIRVVRHYFPQQPFMAGQGAYAANAVISSLNGYRHPNLYVELYNEPMQSQVGGLIAFTAEAVPILHQAGLRCAAFSWGTGQPEDAIWHEIAANGWCGLDPANDAIALHEYSPDWQIDGWNMGRFQRLLDIDPRWHIVITETGFDSGGGNGGGWMAHGSLDQLYDLLHRYDALIGAAPHVLGATVFTAQPTPDWSNFDFDDTFGQFTIGGTPMPHSVGPGFKQYATDHTLTILSDEFYIAGDQVSAAATDKGLMVYTKDDNTVHFVPFGQPA